MTPASSCLLEVLCSFNMVSVLADDCLSCDMDPDENNTSSLMAVVLTVSMDPVIVWLNSSSIYHEII